MGLFSFLFGRGVCINDAKGCDGGVVDFFLGDDDDGGGNLDDLWGVDDVTTCPDDNT